MQEKMTVKDSVTFILNGKPVEFNEEKREDDPKQETSENTPKEDQKQP